MSKYNNLKKLNSDIELLESAGLIKAANVLHKKFVKEAQGDSLNEEMQPDITKNLQLKSLEDNKNIFESNIENIIYKNYFVQDSVDAAAKALSDIRNLESSTYPEVQLRAKQLVSIFEPRYYDIVNKYQGKPKPAVQENKTDYTKYNLPLLFRLEDFQSESALYNAALNKIKQEFFYGDRDLAEKVFQDTIVQFTQTRTKQQFKNQVQNLRTRAYRRDPKTPLFNQDRN